MKTSKQPQEFRKETGEKLRKHIEEIVLLTDEEFEYVKMHFTVLTFKKHQFLIQEGQEVNNDFWVVKGLVKAYSNSSEGKEHIMQFAAEDWWVTDYKAYFNRERATLNVSCLEDTEVWCLSLENRDKVCAGLHKAEHFFRRKSNSGYTALQRRILSLLSSTAKERYDEFLTQYPNLMQRIPKTLIASYLGVSRETLSRLSSS